MNERIKTLRRLAIDELNQHFFSCPNNWDELVQEKVAELIVKECMTICEDVTERNDPLIACYYEIKRTFWS